jgi:hypothetical protein
MTEYEDMCVKIKEIVHRKKSNKNNIETVSFFVVPNNDTLELRLLLLIDNPNNSTKLGANGNQKLPVVFSSGSSSHKYKLVQLMMDAKNQNAPLPKECEGWDLTKREVF